MSKVLNEVLAANQAYSQAFGAKGELPLPPARQFAILTCMTLGSIRPNMPDSPRATPMSFAMPAGAPLTTPCGHW
jgi:hypothetical protein